MLLHKIQELYELLEHDALSLLYLGDESDQMTDKLIQINEENLKSQQQGQLGRKMAFLIAESFQNIVRHHQPAESPKEVQQPNMFMLRHSAGEISVSSANRMAQAKVADLEYQLNHLSTLSQQQLRRLYLGILPESNRTEGGGAGLGLIEMARKTGQSFTYTFSELADDPALAMFYFQLKLRLDEQSIGAEHTLGGMQQMYRIMQSHQVLLLYRSNFAQESMLPVLSMIEHNVALRQPNRFKQKATLYILVEMFQNIMKHAAIHRDKQDGVLLLARRNNRFVLCTGNFIENNKVEELRNHLLKINQLDDTELQQLYRTELTNERKSVKGGAGLGLIEAARYGQLPYDFSFISAHSGYSFFTLCLEV